ncbi:hypothetical protein HanRHA438_Chr12g0534921 [Helianthus annuus]|uniref:Uncharacterized protein n=1 Tax=Helianthus annuus TaxID=4232 RepID=A0A9K3EM69_HELAN|nr:hypothetical protein HanXRQr2_Chr12g0523331 [Helianthus annuus]KAJ0488080.1 hypothetical protein HanHA300_Chr12g0429061 [Helianthus annuus]KAJ0503891.1 hypothetical protein HanHA89_Chr12g0453341 [Helianthus annuus]KAJ0673577.1 hypothetical protein HanLR1_Chr12g0430681 [Helianthus annuus]KAJ0676933.1 hypothetical protein HanOQP8_Chr12g0431431 [Helianthus annuus]
MAYNSTLNYLNLVRRLTDARYHVPEDIKSSLMGYAKSVYQSDLENRYSEPMVWIGIYIALASLCCILAMLADLLHGLRSRKLWIPCKYFTFNAASLTVIAVAMKLPVDLTGPMPGVVDQLAKLGSMAFMCNIDVACVTENEDQHVDSTNTRVVLPQPPNCNPKATEFEVKIQ